MELAFKDYIIGLPTATITTGSDYIPFYDSASWEVRKGTLAIPTAPATFVIGLVWTSGSGATATTTSARVSYDWYLVNFEIHATVASVWTCTWDFTITWPYIPSNSTIYPLSWGIYASWGIVTRWIPYAQSWVIKLISSAPSTNLNWSSVSVGDLIFISWFYEV